MPTNYQIATMAIEILTLKESRRQGADIQSKVEELEELNQALQNCDKMKDDAIAQLSDQVMANAVI